MGKISASTGSVNCATCAAGQFEDVTGSAACEQCPVGTVPHRSSTSCKPVVGCSSLPMTWSLTASGVTSKSSSGALVSPPMETKTSATCKAVIKVSAGLTSTAGITVWARSLPAEAIGTHVVEEYELAHTDAKCGPTSKVDPVTRADADLKSAITALNHGLKTTADRPAEKTDEKETGYPVSNLLDHLLRLSDMLKNKGTAHGIDLSKMHGKTVRRAVSQTPKNRLRTLEACKAACTADASCKFFEFGKTAAGGICNADRTQCRCVLINHACSSVTKTVAPYQVSSSAATQSASDTTTDAGHHVYKKIAAGTWTQVGRTSKTSGGEDVVVDLGKLFGRSKLVQLSVRPFGPGGVTVSSFGRTGCAHTPKPRVDMVPAAPVEPVKPGSKPVEPMLNKTVCLAAGFKAENCVDGEIPTVFVARVKEFFVGAFEEMFEVPSDTDLAALYEQGSPAQRTGDLEAFEEAARLAFEGAEKAKESLAQQIGVWEKRQTELVAEETGLHKELVVATADITKAHATKKVWAARGIQFAVESGRPTLRAMGHTVSAPVSCIVAKDTWTHVAMTYAVGSAIKIYVDGKACGSSATAPKLNAALARIPLYFGRTSTRIVAGPAVGAAAEMVGMIATPRVWTTARTLAELVDKKTAFVQGSEKGLLCVWGHDIEQNRIMEDRGAHGYDAVMLSTIGRNAPVWDAKALLPHATDTLGKNAKANAGLSKTLGKPFYFRQSCDMAIDHVYHPDSESTNAVAMKKSIISMFSHTVKKSKVGAPLFYEVSDEVGKHGAVPTQYMLLEDESTQEIVLHKHVDHTIAMLDTRDAMSLSSSPAPPSEAAPRDMLVSGCRNCIDLGHCKECSNVEQDGVKALDQTKCEGQKGTRHFKKCRDDLLDSQKRDGNVKIVNVETSKTSYGSRVLKSTEAQQTSSLGQTSDADKLKEDTKGESKSGVTMTQTPVLSPAGATPVYHNDFLELFSTEGHLDDDDHHTRTAVRHLHR